MSVELSAAVAKHCSSRLQTLGLPAALSDNGPITPRPCGSAAVEVCTPIKSTPPTRGKVASAILRIDKVTPSPPLRSRTLGTFNAAKSLEREKPAGGYPLTTRPRHATTLVQQLPGQVVEQAPIQHSAIQEEVLTAESVQKALDENLSLEDHTRKGVEWDVTEMHSAREEADVTVESLPKASVENLSLDEHGGQDIEQAMIEELPAEKQVLTVASVAKAPVENLSLDEHKGPGVEEQAINELDSTWEEQELAVEPVPKAPVEGVSLDEHQGQRVQQEPTEERIAREQLSAMEPITKALTEGTSSVKHVPVRSVEKAMEGCQPLRPAECVCKVDLGELEPGVPPTCIPGCTEERFLSRVAEAREVGRSPPLPVASDRRRAAGVPQCFKGIFTRLARTQCTCLGTRGIR